MYRIYLKNIQVLGGLAFFLFPFIFPISLLRSSTVPRRLLFIEPTFSHFLFSWTKVEGPKEIFHLHLR